MCFIYFFKQKKYEQKFCWKLLDRKHRYFHFFKLKCYFKRLLVQKFALQVLGILLKAFGSKEQYDRCYSEKMWENVWEFPKKRGLSYT